MLLQLLHEYSLPELKAATFERNNSDKINIE